MAPSKIRQLVWNVCAPTVYNRSYSSINMPINIGYAGRIVKEQKRMDYIVPIALALKEKDISFRMTIAGTGTYEKKLKSDIDSHKLNDCINMLGLLEHDKIFDFWLSQDVCLSCSDWEGHSISHSEAMAVGTVPILTNTSGAEDDVTDGETGFIVDIGDVDAIVNCIAELYYDRDLLRYIGNNILKRDNLNEKIEKQDEFWNSFFDGELL